MSESARYLTMQAGLFRLALPLDAVKQILDAGGAHVPVAPESAAAGPEPVSLARVLGGAALDARPATLVFDRAPGELLLSVCVLGDVCVAGAPRALPATVACRWPGLVRGTIDDPIDGGLRLVLDVRVLFGLVEAG